MSALRSSGFARRATSHPLLFASRSPPPCHHTTPRAAGVGVALRSHRQWGRLRLRLSRTPQPRTLRPVQGLHRPRCHGDRVSAARRGRRVLPGSRERDTLPIRAEIPLTPFHTPPGGFRLYRRPAQIGVLHRADSTMAPRQLPRCRPRATHRTKNRLRSLNL